MPVENSQNGQIFQSIFSTRFLFSVWENRWSSYIYKALKLSSYFSTCEYITFSDVSTQLRPKSRMQRFRLVASFAHVISILRISSIVCNQKMFIVDLAKNYSRKRHIYLFHCRLMKAISQRLDNLQICKPLFMFIFNHVFVLLIVFEHFRKAIQGRCSRILLCPWIWAYQLFIIS